jgi:stringent starvation protein B
MYEWIVDSGRTPHAIVDATREGVQVPAQHVSDGRIVLNLSPTATQALLIGADLLEFNARFGGVSHYVRVPLTAVQGIFARETGEGMVFEEELVPTDPPPESPSSGSDHRLPATGSAAPKAKRPSLKVVK